MHPGAAMNGVADRESDRPRGGAIAIAQEDQASPRRPAIRQPAASTAGVGSQQRIYGRGERI